MMDQEMTFLRTEREVSQSQLSAEQMTFRVAAEAFQDQVNLVEAASRAGQEIQSEAKVTQLGLEWQRAEAAAKAAFAAEQAEVSSALQVKYAAQEEALLGRGLR